MENKITIDQNLKNKSIKNIPEEVVNVNEQLEEVTDYFKRRIPMVKDIVNLIVKFKNARAKQELSSQVKIWNELLTKFVIFDLDTDIAGDKMRKISHELVHEAEILHLENHIFKDIEHKSELL